MKNNSTQREILLMINTSFAQRQWYNKEQKTQSQTPEENLEEACANGLIQELLPEVFKAGNNAKMYLWQMHPGFSFLQLELGEMPAVFQKEYSLNPHEFLPTLWLS